MKTLKTRNGNVCLLFSAGGIEPHPLIGAIQTPEGLIAFEWTAAGFVNNDGSEHEMDIAEGLAEWLARPGFRYVTASSGAFN